MRNAIMKAEDSSLAYPAATSEGYTYGPLLEDQFRLFHLHPRTVDGKLRGDLVQYSLHDRPPYRTLSYCWGGGEKPKTISINGCDVWITQNLFDALKRLQSWNSVTLWIDAICINQDDNDEKSVQVQRMRDIYTGMPMTIWIHDYSTSVPLLEVEEIFLRLMPARTLRHYLPRHAPVELRDRARTLIKHDDLWALLDFFKAAWFTRVWVLQEAVCASKITLRYGSYSVHWLRVVHVAGGLWKFFNLESVASKLPHSFMDVVELEKAEPHKPPDPGLPVATGSRLHNLLGMARVQKCSDARDHWYGYLGLLSNEIDIRPDYNSSVEEVYLALTSYCIRGGSLDILNFVEHTLNRLSLPSWSIELTQQTAKPLDIMHACTGGQYIYSVPQALNLVRIEEHVLYLPMYIVDYITHEIANTAELHSVDVTEALDNLRIAQRTDEEANRYKSMLTLVDDLNGSYVTGEAMRQAFWRTLCCDMNSEGQPPDSSFAANFEMYHRLTLGGMTAWNKASQDDMARYRTFNVGPEHYSNRHFIRSRKGYIGWAPRATRPGHMIAVIAGARMPFIFEVTGDRLRMIGHAYIHGLMDQMVDGDTAELTDEGRRLITGPLRILPIV